MTLVVTELSAYGIVMVEHVLPVDTTPAAMGRTGKAESDGFVTMQMVPHLPAGVCAWGCEVLPTLSRSVATSEWLAEFIRRHGQIDGVEAFALALTQALQTEVQGLQEPLGFHIAGYVQVDGQPLPTLYHVRNNEAVLDEYYLHKFQPVQEFPPRDLTGRIFRLRSSDCGRHGMVYDTLEDLLPRLETDTDTNLTVPHPSLEGRMAYMGACVNFASGLYTSAAPDAGEAVPNSRSGKTTLLGIAPNGQYTYA